MPDEEPELEEPEESEPVLLDEPPVESEVPELLDEPPVEPDVPEEELPLSLGIGVVVVLEPLGLVDDEPLEVP